MKGVSEKFKSIVNRYNIRSIFKAELNLRSSVMKTRPETDPQQTAQCVYIIPCECGTSYTGAVGLREHRHSLKEGLLEKTKLSQHAYKGGHRVG
jgi:hypothetical protein